MRDIELFISHTYAVSRTRKNAKNTVDYNIFQQVHQHQVL